MNEWTWTRQKTSNETLLGIENNLCCTWLMFEMNYCWCRIKSLEAFREVFSFLLDHETELIRATCRK